MTLAKPNQTLSPPWGKSVGGVSERPTRVDGESDLFSATRGCNDGERHPVLQDGGTLRGVPFEWRARSVRHAGRSSTLVGGRTGDMGMSSGKYSGGERRQRAHSKSARTQRKRHDLPLLLRDASFAGPRGPCTQIGTQPPGGYLRRVSRSKQHRGRANP